ncbi:MAG TPA: sulfurtransferase TusA family protein [Planctomycetaceae bacterium]|nr:sulfurtransferase TusA family protein [Planctomycetaceae bacterium]
MVLDRMKSGEVLSVLLDRDGAANVPESAEKDGHQILAVRQHSGHWQVLIRRK